MAKNFKNATDILVPPSPVSRPEEEERTGMTGEEPETTGTIIEKKKSPGRPKSVGYSRTSVMMNDIQLAKLRYISTKEDVPQKDLFEMAFDFLLQKYEEKNGIIELDSKNKRNVKELF